MKNRVMLTFATITIALAGFVLAHSQVKSSLPADDSTVKTLPSQVRLDFKEGFEANFSSFRVYRLDSKSGDHEVIESAAEKLIKQVFDQKMNITNRVDTGFSAPSKTRALVKLKAGSSPGWYAVVWKLLGTDTHTVKGFIVFKYKP
jgi:copper resistance protein C